MWSRAPGRIASGVIALALLATAVLVPLPSSAQVTDAEVERLRKLHFREEQQVRLVQVPAVVTTRRGRIVRGLGSDDFRLYEDQVPQPIRYFNTESDLPVSIAFLLDVSGSMRQVGKLDEAKEAIRVFVDALGAHDRFGLVAFADDQVAWITEFTADREHFLRRLEVQEAFGQTALFDAIAATPKLVDAEVGGSRAIVLLTDGIDTASHLGTLDALQLARSVNVPIYGVAFASLASKLLPRGAKPPTELVLELFTEETGGRLFSVYDPDDLKEAVLEIQSELRFRYVLSYEPTAEAWDGSFRRIRLVTRDEDLLVRTRTGYYARP